jgi:hypothetical protein
MLGKTLCPNNQLLDNVNPWCLVVKSSKRRMSRTNGAYTSAGYPHAADHFVVLIVNEGGQWGCIGMEI